MLFMYSRTVSAHHATRQVRQGPEAVVIADHTTRQVRQGPKAVVIAHHDTRQVRQWPKAVVMLIMQPAKLDRGQRP